MRSQREGELSAITKVKVCSPEIPQIAQGQRVHNLEASTAICANGEHINPTSSLSLLIPRDTRSFRLTL